MPSPAKELRSQIAIRVGLAAVCFAIAIWGIWLCRDFAHSPMIAGPYPSLNDLIGVLGWLIFFGPFALLGVLAARRARALIHLSRAQRQAAAPVEILPPIYSGPMPPRVPVPTIPHAPNPEPLDDATRRHLDHVATRAARLAGVISGSLLLTGGTAGFVLAWIQAYRPSTFTGLHPGLASFRITLYFLLACGGCVLLGLYILRETFSRPRTGWLAPLGVLGAVVRRKAEAEQAQRKLRE